MLKRIFTGAIRRLSPSKAAGAGSGGGRKKQHKINPTHHLIQIKQPLAVEAFHNKVIQMGRAIPTETYKKRMNHWKRIKKNEVRKKGHAGECSQNINKEIQTLTTLEYDGVLTREILEVKTKVIEENAASLTDEVLLVKHGKFTPRQRAEELQRLFDAGEWNSNYTNYISDLWHTMPSSLQHSLIERLEK